MSTVPLDTLRRQIDEFLTGPMADALRAVEYRPPAFGSVSTPLADAVSCRVEAAHLLGNPDATYLLHAFGETLRMQIQLNVYRLVVVYSLPVSGTMDSSALQPRLARWEIGAGHAGWRMGWRDTVDVERSGERHVEIYCYAMLPEDFLVSDRHKLYWMNDIVQMTHALFLEAKRSEISMSLP